MFNFTAEKTRKSFKRSLELLGLDYVDIIQVHDIEFAPSLNMIITQTLPELSRQVSEGKAKQIGITGYPVSILKECIDLSNIKISCILSYSRFTLIDDTLEHYIPFFKERNIGIICASAPCMGLLTNHGPPEWHPASEDTKKKCSEAAEYCKDHNVELGKLAAWYSMQCKDIDTSLIGIQNMRDLQCNLQVVYEGINDDEKKLLEEIKEKFLSKIKDKHWEGVELKKYWNAMNK
ncbi:L-galactose dehydrogenase isoform X2 [Cephus cinctus]|nr:L-galactose dehydrogenase isoform X2 [Cephus cinctus]